MLLNADPVLIVALSGRALARSARAAMIPVTVLDVFCDTDTQVWADTTGCIGDVANGIDELRLLALADNLCSPKHCSGLVYGAGFESKSRVLSILAEERKLFGNDPEVLADIGSPEHFFGILERLGVPFPEIRFQYPPDPNGWLAKRAGASGGVHVQSAQYVIGQDGYYYQREVHGRTMSILFLANGHEANIVGISEQWNSGAGNTPYSYAGAVSHQRISKLLYGNFTQLTRALTQQWKLVGLNSIDLVVDGDDFQVLEVNARPTATAELYDFESHESLFSQHLHACCGGTLNYRGNSARMYAHWRVYAEHDLHVPYHFTWPNWCSDRPMAGSYIHRDEPVCTVHASGDSLFGLNGFLKRRIRFIQEVFVSARVSTHETVSRKAGVIA